MTVNITASKNQICEGDSVKFTASQENGGSTPSYQWEINGNKAGTNSSIFKYMPIYNDTIECILTSDLPGALNNPATSNKIIISVSKPISINPSFHIQSQCLRDSIGFTLIPSAGAGTYSYQWFLNGDAIAGATNSLYSKQYISETDSGKYSCIISNSCNSDTGDVVLLTVIDCNRTHHKIKGYVSYDNKSQTAMNSYTINSRTLVFLYNEKDSIIDKTQTDDNGYFEFVNLINGIYYVTGTSNKEWGGSNPVDALWINRDYISVVHIADSLFRKAGDLDSNRILNPADALLINKRYIGVIRKFPVNDWKFEKIEVIMQDADIRQDIRAICSGDVNGSYVPSN